VRLAAAGWARAGGLPISVDANRAVILAGGLGTRLRPLTEKAPKPMLCINGRPFLSHQLQLLQSNGIHDVLLLVAYLGEQIEEYFGDGSGCGMNISYSREPAPMGTGGALKLAESKLHSEFLLLNGDTYLDISYRELISAYRDAECLALIAAYENSGDRLASNLALAPDLTVKMYSKQKAAGLTHVDAGAILLSKQVLQWIPSGRNCSLEEEIFPVLIEKKQMRAWPTSVPFIDMGSSEGLSVLSRRLA
jgi:mannose-1-phosphate guanylyltransferase